MTRFYSNEDIKAFTTEANADAIPQGRACYHCGAPLTDDTAAEEWIDRGEASDWAEVCAGEGDAVGCVVDAPVEAPQGASAVQTPFARVTERVLAMGLETRQECIASTFAAMCQAFNIPESEAADRVVALIDWQQAEYGDA